MSLMATSLRSSFRRIPISIRVSGHGCVSMVAPDKLCFAVAGNGAGALGSTDNQPVSPGSLQPGRRIGSGRATWYEQRGRTASGEMFDPNRLTAAHPTLPFGTRLRVVNQANGRSVVVRINDRSPSTRTSVLNLSRGSARALGIAGTGLVALHKLDE